MADALSRVGAGVTAGVDLLGLQVRLDIAITLWSQALNRARKVR